MAAIEVIESASYVGQDSRPYLRLVTTPQVFRSGPSLAQRRAARARMMQRRRRTLVGLGLVLSAALAWVSGNYDPVRQLFFAVDANGRTGLTILGVAVAFVFWHRLRAVREERQ